MSSVTNPNVRLISLLAMFLLLGCVAIRPPARECVASPSGHLEAELALDSPAAAPRLSIRLDGRELLRTEGLGLVFADAPPFGPDVELTKSTQNRCERDYEFAFGARRALIDRHVQTIWTMRERNSPHRVAELHLRVHDDGVSYRWRVLDWPGVQCARVVAELANQRILGEPRAFPLYRENYRTSHEGPYAKVLASKLEPARLIDLPLLFAHDDGRCLALTEADVRDYPHSYLERASGDSAELQMRLSPRIDDPSVAALVEIPFQTPWRVCMVGSSIATLLESNLLLHLCEESRIPDTSWIQPGKQTWHWWNGTFVNATDEGGVNFTTMCAYIDFCAKSGIRFHAINGQEQPWYEQSRRSVLPSSDADVLTPRKELRWDELLAYALARGVSLRLWTHWQALAPKLEQAFALYERWGVSGLMVDFLDRDDQEMVQFCERVLELAAQHHLTIQFHGSFKPTGLQRTWPNLMNHEGSANLEVLKWADTADPAHDLLVLFTRGLAGPLDYHLGGFRAARREQFAPHYLRPQVLGTRARALANYVVLQNPLPMVCDYPAAYDDQPGFDFLVEIPTVWDESHVLSAAIGEHLAWARRQGTRWYVGALTNWTARELDLPLTFLGPGPHSMRLYADPESDTADPNVVVESHRIVAATDLLRLRLASGGGAVAVIDG